MAREGYHPLVPECTLVREGDPQRLNNGYDPLVLGCTLATEGDPLDLHDPSMREGDTRSPSPIREILRW